MSRLVSRQVTKDNIAYFCDYCTFTHGTKEVVLKHQEQCSINDEKKEPIKGMPKAEEKVKFKITNVAL